MSTINVTKDSRGPKLLKKRGELPIEHSFDEAYCSSKPYKLQRISLGPPAPGRFSCDPDTNNRLSLFSNISSISKTTAHSGISAKSLVSKLSTEEREWLEVQEAKKKADE